MTARYNPELYVNRDKFILAQRLYGNSKKRWYIKLSGAHPRATAESVVNMAARLGCSPMELIDIPYYQQVFGCPVWAVKLLGYEAKADKWAMERFIVSFTKMMARFRKLGLDQEQFFRYVAGWTARDDYAKRSMVMAKWLCQDGGGPFVYAALRTMMNDRAAVPPMADAVKEAILEAHAATQETRPE